jgi:hypothetical protein
MPTVLAAEAKYWVMVVIGRAALQSDRLLNLTRGSAGTQSRALKSAILRDGSRDRQ